MIACERLVRHARCLYSRLGEILVWKQVFHFLAACTPYRQRMLKLRFFTATDSRSTSSHYSRILATYPDSSQLGGGLCTGCSDATVVEINWQQTFARRLPLVEFSGDCGSRLFLEPTRFYAAIFNLELLLI
jgi:hypothetical protein